MSSQKSLSTEINSGSQKHNTPLDIISPISEAIGGFDLDPCASDDSNLAETNIRNTGGLQADWTEHNTVWLNHPYARGESGKWLQKAVDSVENGVDTVVTLSKCDTSTDWFHEYYSEAAVLCFPDKRLSFVNGDSTADFPNVFGVFGEVPSPLEEHLQSIGWVTIHHETVGWISVPGQSHQIDGIESSLKSLSKPSTSESNSGSGPKSGEQISLLDAAQAEVSRREDAPQFVNANEVHIGPEAVIQATANTRALDRGALITKLRKGDILTLNINTEVTGADKVDPHPMPTVVVEDIRDRGDYCDLMTYYPETDTWYLLSYKYSDPGWLSAAISNQGGWEPAVISGIMVAEDGRSSTTEYKATEKSLTASQVTMGSFS